MKTTVYLIALIMFAVSGAASALRVLPLPEGVSSYHDHIYLSAVPTEEAAQALRAMGVTAMVDLRGEEENTAGAAAIAQRNGISYFSAPIAKTGAFLPGQIRAVEAIAERNRTRKIWFFCSSGNRAAAWLAIHLAEKEGRTAGAAIAEARALGLKNEQTIEKVRAYLGRKQN